MTILSVNKTRDYVIASLRQAEEGLHGGGRLAPIFLFCGQVLSAFFIARYLT